MIRFNFESPKSPLKGKLLFLRNEYSFYFEVEDDLTLTERTGSEGIASISLGDLQIKVGIETGILCYVWGFHPIESWDKECLPPFVAIPGLIRAHGSNKFQHWCGYDLCPNVEWKTLYDSNSGWVQVRKDGENLKGDFIEFANGCVALIRDHTLVSLFLRPCFKDTY